MWHHAGQAAWAWPPLVLTALVVGFAITLQQARPMGLSGSQLLWGAAAIGVVGLWGARAMHVLADGQLEAYVWRCLDPTRLAVAGVTLERDCWAALRLGRGGFSLYGGLLAGGAAAYLGCKLLKWPQLLLADAAALALPVAIGVGRIGCWLAGCCFGEPTQLSFPLATVASAGSLAAAAHGDGVSVWSTQLIEAFGCALLALALWGRRKPMKAKPGRLFALSVLGYGTLRFGVEWLRGDPRGHWLEETVSPSQAIAIITILGALWWLRRAPITNAEQARALEAPCTPS